MPRSGAVAAAPIREPIAFTSRRRSFHNPSSVISLGRISVRLLINMVLEMVLSLGDLQGRNAVFPKAIVTSAWLAETSGLDHLVQLADFLLGVHLVGDVVLDAQVIEERSLIVIEGSDLQAVVKKASVLSVVS